MNSNLDLLSPAPSARRAGPHAAHPQEGAHTTRAASEADSTVAPTQAFLAFRRRARALLANGVTPEAAAPQWWQWRATAGGATDGAADSGDLWASADLPEARPENKSEPHPGMHPTAPSAEKRPAPAVPRGFMALAQRVVLHRDPARFELLYRVLWRLQHEPTLRHDPLDADVLRLRQLARAVQRDAYKMRAFVRFRPVREGPSQDGLAPEATCAAQAAGSALVPPIGKILNKIEPLPLQHLPEQLSIKEHLDHSACISNPPHTGADTLHIAWFEPEHDVVEAVAPWFARRFAGMRWAILTPRRSVRWEPATQQLSAGPGARRDQAPAPDAGEALWLTYYRHIFNPARLNLRQMQQHMPRKYWANLPEAAQIAELAAHAAARTAAMIAPADAQGNARHASVDTADAALTRLCPSSNLSPALVRAPAYPVRSLADLHAATQRCTACSLSACATQAVNGRGPLHAPLMLVGEQPGDHEDLAGEPFVGPAGQLLNQALAAAGVKRDTLFLTNAVRHFKHELRGKRRLHKTPAQREADACRQWLMAEIDVVQPAALMALGATAARALLGPSLTLAKARGRWWPGPGARPVFVTWHPAALLRMPPEQRQSVWPQWVDDVRAAAAGPTPAQREGIRASQAHPLHEVTRAMR